LQAFTNVSEKYIASIFRAEVKVVVTEVKRSSESLETTYKKTTSQNPKDNLLPNIIHHLSGFQNAMILEDI
jgi:hypothetical protein